MSTVKRSADAGRVGGERSPSTEEKQRRRRDRSSDTPTAALKTALYPSALSSSSTSAPHRRPTKEEAKEGILREGEGDEEEEERFEGLEDVVDRSDEEDGAAVRPKRSGGGRKPTASASRKVRSRGRTEDRTDVAVLDIADPYHAKSRTPHDTTAAFLAPRPLSAALPVHALTCFPCALSPFVSSQSPPTTPPL